MKDKKTFVTQFFVFFCILFLINSISWLVLNLVNAATFVTEETWDNNQAFKSRLFAKALYDENQKVKSVYEPFSIWKHTSHSGKYIKSNEFGERNFNLKKSPGNLNVRLFGGSTMWGVGASDDSTIAAFLSKFNNKLNVYNHGMQGFNSRQSFERLITLYQQGNASDIVIFYDGVNEIGMCSRTISLPGHFQEDLIRTQVTNRNANPKPRTVIWRGLSNVFFNSTFEMTQRIHRKFFLDTTIEKCKSGYICNCDSSRAGEIARMLVNNWEIAKAVVESKGGQFYAILQPVFSEGNANISYLGMENNNYLYNYKENYSAIYSKIRKELVSRKINWVFDFSETLNGEEPHYIDFCHINSLGNRKIAKNIDSLILNYTK